jgi:4-hydroxy-tetrahydrodipicolinate synthase
MNKVSTAVPGSLSAHGVALETKSDRARIAGVYAPTVTAFASDGSVDFDGIRRFTRFLLDQHVHGLTPLGSAGEPLALSLEERKGILEVIVEETAGQVPIFVGVVEYGTQSTIDLGLHAKALGCDGLMLSPPYVLRPPRRDVMNHFRRVRDRVGLPIMLYNVPVLTGYEVTPDDVRQLAEEDVLHAVKWSHAEISRIHDTRALCGPSFPVFAGVDLIAFGALAAGADGWIGGLPMMVPELAVRLYQLLAEQKDLVAARELWARLHPLVRIEYCALGTVDNDPHWLAVCREVADLRGLRVGVPRLPLSRVLPEVREELRAVLVELAVL